MLFLCVCFWLLLLSIISVRFIHVVVYAVDFFFPLLCVIPLYNDFTIYSFHFDAYLGYFKFWALMGKASINILVNMFYKHSVLGAVSP